MARDWPIGQIHSQNRISVRSIAPTLVYEGALTDAVQIRSAPDRMQWQPATRLESEGSGFG